MKTFSIIILAVTVAALTAAQVHAQGQLTDAHHQYETEVTCSAARASGNFTNCYAVEKKYNTEFLCNQSQCWTEQH